MIQNAAAAFSMSTLPVGVSRPKRRGVLKRTRVPLSTHGSHERVVGLAEALFGLVGIIVGVSMVLGTVIHAAHHDDTKRNLAIAALCGLFVSRFLLAVIRAQLGHPGYTISPTLQDLL